jgi:hypothetical protein
MVEYVPAVTTEARTDSLLAHTPNRTLTHLKIECRLACIEKRASVPGAGARSDTIADSNMRRLHFNHSRQQARMMDRRLRVFELRLYTKGLGLTPIRWNYSRNGSNSATETP